MNCLFCLNEMNLYLDDFDDDSHITLYVKYFKCKPCKSFGFERTGGHYSIYNKWMQYFYFNEFILKFNCHKKLTLSKVGVGVIMTLDNCLDINPNNVSTRLKSIMLLS